MKKKMYFALLPPLLLIVNPWISIPSSWNEILSFPHSSFIRVNKNKKNSFIKLSSHKAITSNRHVPTLHCTKPTTRESWYSYFIYITQRSDGRQFKGGRFHLTNQIQNLFFVLFWNMGQWRRPNLIILINDSIHCINILLSPFLQLLFPMLFTNITEWTLFSLREPIHSQVVPSLIPRRWCRIQWFTNGIR